MIQSELIGGSRVGWVMLPVGVGVYVFWRVWKALLFKDSSQQPASLDSKAQNTEDIEAAYYNILPLTNLNVDEEEPIKIRPFKPKYYMTMAIENITLSDFLAVDKTYRSRIQLRRKLIEQHRDEVLALNDRGHPAVFELYEWLVTTYLPRRFPTIFEIEKPAKQEVSSIKPGLRNKTTGEVLPFQASSAAHALQILGEHVDTDLLLLVPSADPEDEGKYRLEAFITCFPSGFRTRSKLGLKLADIHGPVPAYQERLEKSMDRFFASLPVGKIVKRFNWSVTTNTELFNLAGNHLSEEEHEEGKEEEINLGETVMRCERQTLHRLPKTKAVLFAFKTYQYPVRELREEGSGEEMAEAIEGLGKGNSPGMTVYKRQVVWGDKVKAFLRGEIDS